MSETQNPKPVVRGEKLRGADKVARIPVKVIPTVELPRKPDWIRVTLGNNEKVERIRATLRKHKLSSVCEEASCPNLGECFSGGTATFMIMGDICTRRCPFCDVAHGRPNALMENEPLELAEAIAEMGLRYVVVTSVDRDDLRRRRRSFRPLHCGNPSVESRHQGGNPGTRLSGAGRYRHRHPQPDTARRLQP